MKITSIKQQVKRPDRYSIYIDDKYECSLSEGELLRFGLRINQELTAAELERLRSDAVLDKARSQALDQISRRPRSEWELRDYLRRKQHEQSTIEFVIGYLKERDYVNDAEFARRWVENRRLLKPVSRRKLKQELRQKRVDEALIIAALEADQADEREVLRELIARKRRQSKYQDNLKLMQYLSRQGFNYGDIRSVLDEN